MKKLISMVVIASSFSMAPLIARAQGNPTPVLLYTLVGGVPTAATGSGAVLPGGNPPPVLCYGLNGSGQPAPCVFSGSGGSPALSSVTGSAAQATGTETAAGNQYTFAGVETNALTYPFVFTDANSTNNNSSGALIVQTTGTSTGAVPLLLNEAATAGDFLDAYNAATVTNGVASGGSLVHRVAATGGEYLGSTAPAFTAGTAGVTVGSGCGSAPTGVANASLFYCNLANFQDEITQTTDLGAVVTEPIIIPANVIAMGSGIMPQLKPSSINDNNGYIVTTEVVQTGNTKTLTADSGNIVATTAATAVTQFSWTTLPSNTHFAFSCEGTYTQATAAGGVSIAIQGATTAPTDIDAWATLYSTNPASTTVTATMAGLYGLATTTYTLVAAVTPGASATQYQWEMHGTIQTANPGSTLNIGFFSGSASDAVVIKRGSFCTIHP